MFEQFNNLKCIENMKFYSFRYRIISLLIILTLSALLYHNAKPSEGQIQDYFREECEVIKDRLLAQNWKGECGKDILSNKIVIDFELPHMVKAGKRILYIYEEEDFFSGGEGMYIAGSLERIKISLYPINELIRKDHSNYDEILHFGGYGISRSELVHVLVDELVSASMEGKQFVDGVASKQEEVDAWILAEDALKTFYGNDIKVSASFSKPQYGPDNPAYVEACFFLME